MLRRAPIALLLVLALPVLSARPADGQAPVFSPSANGTGTAAVDGDIARALSRIEDLHTRSQRVRAEVGGLGQQRAAARKRLKTRARALYRISRSGALPLGGGFSALLSRMARVDRLERMVRADLSAVANLGRRGKILRAEIGNIGHELTAAKAHLAALRERKSELEQSVEDSSGFEATFRHSVGFRGPSTYATTTGSIRVLDGPVSRGPSFRSLEGRLALPVATISDVREGHRENGTGVELVAPPGTIVRAAAAGRVAFSDRYGAYGRLVILDHGDGYFTVYGGLGHVDVRVGDDIARSAQIGDVGVDPGPPCLFFEVRQGTRTLDARTWLGL